MISFFEVSLTSKIQVNIIQKHTECYVNLKFVAFWLACRNAVTQYYITRINLIQYFRHFSVYRANHFRGNVTKSVVTFQFLELVELPRHFLLVRRHACRCVWPELAQALATCQTPHGYQKNHLRYSYAHQVLF